MHTSKDDAGELVLVVAEAVVEPVVVDLDLVALEDLCELESD